MKELKSLLKNQKGMSLIELTVAAAISVIISMGIVKTNQTGYKGMTKVSTDLDLKMWQQQQLLDRLADPASCSATFATTNIASGGAVADINFSDGSVFVASGDEIAGGNWTVGAMTRGAWAADPGSPNKGKFTLTVPVTRRNKSSFGPENKNLNIDIVAVKAESPSNTLVSCSASSSGGDSLWDLDIANNRLESQGKSVLVGASSSTPLAPFQVELAGDEWLPSSGVRKSINVSGLNQAFTIGASGNENSALYGIQRTDDTNVTNEDCLVMANGKYGVSIPGVEVCQSATHIGSVKSKGHVDTTAPIVPIRGAVTLGASSSNATGNYSISMGERSQAIGSFSFAQGRGAIAKGDYSSAIGSWSAAEGLNSTSIGYSSRALGEESVAIGNAHAKGQGSIALGGKYNTHADGDWSLAFGTGARAIHDTSVVFASRYDTWSTNTNEFTASFRNGFKFITNNAEYPSASDVTNGVSEDTGVFIDGTGNVGIGKNLDFTLDNQFGEGIKPKLFVKGNVEITGSLYANGSKIGGDDTGWLSAPMPTGGAGYWTSTLMCRYYNGVVYLKGGINKTGSIGLSPSQRYLAGLPSDCQPRNSALHISVSRCDRTTRNININQLGVARAGQLRPTDEKWGGSFADDNWFATGTTAATNPTGSGTCWIFFDGISFIRDR